MPDEVVGVARIKAIHRSPDVDYRYRITSVSGMMAYGYTVAVAEFELDFPTVELL